MVHHIYVVSSEWGGNKGGINVFNKSLVEALARVVSKDVEVHSVTESKLSLPTSLGSSLNFLSYDGDAASLVKAIESDLAAKSAKPKSIVIIGHDVHTGPHALDARDMLKAKSVHCRAAVFCHMDYAAYQHYKEKPPANVLAKAQEQRKIVLEADCVYAIGPLLKGSFERLRAAGGGETPIHEIIPGFPEALAQRNVSNPSNALKFFFSGRIDAENDRIKNGRLALRALYDVYTKMTNSNDLRWRQRGSFTAYGFAHASIDEGWFCEGIDRDALGKYLALTLEEFTEQEAMFDQLQDSHAALMPSLHDGFGLTGWEAICAGIPLICSDQSGLAVFLESLFDTDHDLPRESVLMVRLADSDQDVATLSDKIQELTRNYDRRRSHARTLAKYLADLFSWDECARKVANAIDLAQLGSPHWEARQWESAVARRQDGADVAARHLHRAVQLAGEGKALSEWSVTCTALNYLSDINKNPTYASIDNARNQLDAIAGGIAAGYPSDQVSEPKLRCAGRFDVAWRYMAAASNIATSLKTFVESIPVQMMEEIRADSFLNRELIQYSMKYSGEFSGASEEIAKEFFKDILSQSADDILLQTRFARLEAAFPALSSVASLDPVANRAYARERDQCAKVKASNFDLNDLLVSEHALAPTALALATIDGTMRGRGTDQLFETWKEYNAKLPQPTWRGDKLLRAALLAATVHPRALVAFVEALAHDEEEALRWSAVDLAFSPALRTRLFDASRSKALDKSPDQLKLRLGAIVDAALENGGFHPWIQREFLTRFHREHATPVLTVMEERFTASDFPVARQLFGPAPSQASSWQFGRLHPEVQVSARKLHEHLQRVLLVLPPISLASATRDVSQTSTPPLGLGMVGSQLLAQGHDVYLADCHRTPDMAQVVVKSAADFEWLGFNVVLPTIRSMIAIACDIKRRTVSPAIVVGGPAVNARAFRNATLTDEERKCWDFEIGSGVEDNFARLVADFRRQRTELPAGVVPNERSQLVIRAQHSLITESGAYVEQSLGWPNPVLLDRRIFSTPQGDYEPQRTRALNSTAVEAHVVMSRGCDWNCSFCTERRELSRGERRRPMLSVQRELRELARRHGNLRIQFVDDNLLPQIATLPMNDRISRAKALDWSDRFIGELSRVHDESAGKFGWRGIFRVEDFFAYEREGELFIERLAKSGCRMLAFGVEHGNEEKRRRMKVGASASNAQFSNLFNRLRDAGIHSKAYFILGGPKETAETSEETIAFAINSGVSLAYFALYKEFVPAVNSLRSEHAKGSAVHQKFSTYDQLDIQWDRIIGNALKNPNDEAFHRLIASIDPGDEAFNPKDLIAVYDELSRLGFRFSDLVKYSDYHSEASPASEVLSKVNFGDQAGFESKVASAYMLFGVQI